MYMYIKTNVLSFDYYIAQPRSLNIYLLTDFISYMILWYIVDKDGVNNYICMLAIRVIRVSTACHNF